MGELFCLKSCYWRELQMASHIPNGVSITSPHANAEVDELRGLTPEQDYRVRVMGEEELELLRAAASQRGLELTSLNWILASLMNHGFVSISGDNRRLRAVATKAGCLGWRYDPCFPTTLSTKAARNGNALLHPLAHNKLVGGSQDHGRCA